MGLSFCFFFFFPPPIIYQTKRTVLFQGKKKREKKKRRKLDEGGRVLPLASNISDKQLIRRDVVLFPNSQQLHI